jgi:hypothetical protein
MAFGKRSSGTHLVSITLLLLAASVHGYPAYYVELANGCTDHPNTGLGEHGKPVPDK